MESDLSTEHPNPSEEDGWSQAATIQTSPSSGGSTRPPPLHRQSTTGIKRCWICMADQTEDDPSKNIIWRTPCKCNLTAHEDCLLDWVQDLEHPDDNREPATKIECPQCKSEIKIARPRSYIVDAYKAIDSAFSTLVVPGLGLTLVGMIWSGAWVHGFHSVIHVFGTADAIRIFEETQKHVGWSATYAIIPFNLISARTKFADFVLPSGTLFLLSTQLTDGFEIDMTIWPPLPSTVFACLPAVRSGYNWAYNKAFGNLNKRWFEQIHPRHTELGAATGDNATALQNQAAGGGDGDVDVVLQVEVNLGGRIDEVIVEEPANIQDQDAADGNQEPANPEARNEQQNGQGNGLLDGRGNQIIETTSSFGTTIIGALAFPFVASGMGELIGLVIPKLWKSNANVMNGRPGLLRTKWGRSVVGGCLFIVLKDAMTLYCRWRLAQSQSHRRIVDYDKQAKKYLG